jgi:hypothetical protein
MRSFIGRILFLPAVVMVLVAGAPLLAARAAEEERQPSDRLDAEAIAKMWVDFYRLAPEHEEFKKVVGEWTVDAKYYWENPEEPKQTQAASTFKLILDGRFLQQSFHDTIDGNKYEGMGVSGYDKARKKFVGIWVDNMATGMMYMEGEKDEDGNVVDYGESTTPMGKTKVKMVTTPLRDNKFTFTMYMVLPDGTETKGMELTYSRK